MFDQLDERGVPASRGIPKAVRIAVLIGVAIIFFMGFWTIYNSTYSHVWPSLQSLRVPLNHTYKPE